ncbi:hypothetical protein [Ureibacillus thermosphaericus]|uniref:Uncharacterized protein n=1 Tax=Ureibacillus thermosphaericus TaxID=51173 RepID=A0A840PWM0_URETH|nr:hypothetical protein [Ureibacillus thermosphaericus]MBB5149694.1 hypothetical protein [Ureibacillus thermosphaericus]NKZ32488.1 hypothetical protein [Ureibacillus thermosphaericus]
MKRKVIALIVTMFLFIVLFISGYLYYLNNPYMQIRTEITPIDDETYQTLGALEYVEHPDQKNFRKMLFTFKFKYSNQVENINTEMSESIRNLLSSNVYWTGEGFEYDNIDKKEYIVQEEIVLYTGEITEEEIKERLKEGVFVVKWIEDGEEKQKEYNIGETVMFIQ